MAEAGCGVAQLDASGKELRPSTEQRFTGEVFTFGFDLCGCGPVPVPPTG
jgi:hypothetical protein